MLQNIRFYTDTKKIGVNSAEGFKTFNLNSVTRIAKKQMGTIDYLEEEQKWVSDTYGKRFVADRSQKSQQGEFYLHYVSLNDMCSFFKLKLSFDEQTNTYRIY
jgi:hypothetical protein